MKKTLIIRFSALGDVAMTVPVIASCASNYPESLFYVLSTEKPRLLFEHLAPNIVFIAADLKGRHSGISGLFRLFRELSELNIDFVADFHGVVRSHFLRIAFYLSGTKTQMINKGRKEKWQLTRKTRKIFTPLKSVFDRYIDVLKGGGYNFNLNSNYTLTTISVKYTDFDFTTKKNRIGIAPFAQHHWKIYPQHLMEEIISYLNNQPDTAIFIFGGGEAEKQLAEHWSNIYASVTSTVGKLTLSAELALMKSLDLMLSMDSANMHLASLVGCRVVSVWGATHPYAGFYGWQQSEEDAIQHSLSCRPCSVYGNKECHRNDHACMNKIASEVIIQKIIKSVVK